jgi:hypothetical protein
MTEILALPYHDRELDAPGTQRRVIQLVDAEMKLMDGTQYASQLPEIPYIKVRSRLAWWCWCQYHALWSHRCNNSLSMILFDLIF